MTQYAPQFLSPFWWTASSFPAGFDSVYKCNRFKFAIPSIVEQVGCFANAQTPVYMNTTVVAESESTNVFIQFGNWKNGPQNPSIFAIPQGCAKENSFNKLAGSENTNPLLRAANEIVRLFTTPKK